MSRAQLHLPGWKGWVMWDGEPIRVRSRLGRLAALLLVTVAMAGCERERRNFRPTPPLGAPVQIAQSELFPGGARRPAEHKSPSEDNAFDIAEGRRYYLWFNCVGCHFHGGGGIGPPLMDEKWIYGGKPENIVATIMEGRPNGMPSFRGKITERQAWQIAAYVRSLSGEAAKAAVPARTDAMNTRPTPPTLENRENVPPRAPPQR